MACARRTPGDSIRDEILDELDLSVTQTVEILGLRCATLSGLANGHVALSAEMALRIEKWSGIDMETLMRMQT